MAYMVVQASFSVQLRLKLNNIPRLRGPSWTFMDTQMDPQMDPDFRRPLVKKGPAGSLHGPPLIGVKVAYIFTLPKMSRLTEFY